MQKPNITYFGYPGIREAYKFDVASLFRIEQQQCYQTLRDVVCEFYQIKPESFHSKDKPTALVEARQLFCYIAKLELFPRSTLKGIGKFIRYNSDTGEQYDHTTVMHGIREVRNRLDPKVRTFTRSDITSIILTTNARLAEVWLTSVSARKKVEIAVEILQSKS